MIKRDLIIAVLATFCLTATLFLILPVRSTGKYDPWADINGDGKINMIDVGYIASLFGTSGDPTRNVTVTNWPTNWPSTTQTLLQGELTLFGIRTTEIHSSLNSTVDSEFVTDMESYAEYPSTNLTVGLNLNPFQRVTVLNETVMTYLPFQTVVQVNGNARIRLKLISGGPNYCWVSLYLEKISPSASTTVIGFYNLTQVLSTCNVDGYLEVPVSGTFNIGDRFAVRLLDQLYNPSNLPQGGGAIWYFSGYNPNGSCDYNFYVDLPVSTNT
jgi:hypothetical protein